MPRKTVLRQGPGQNHGRCGAEWCGLQGPLYKDGLTLIPAWMNNHMPSKVWGEITYLFLNFNGSADEV